MKAASLKSEQGELPATQHAPAPWTVVIEREEKSFCQRTGNPRSPGAHIRVNSADSRSVHSIYANNDYAFYPLAEAEANAALIAASPDLLESAEALVRAMETNTCYTGFGKFDQSAAQDFYNQPQIKALVSAIAKARGES